MGYNQSRKGARVRLIGAVLKTVGCNRPVGSNPTPSARYPREALTLWASQRNRMGRPQTAPSTCGDDMGFDWMNFQDAGSSPAISTR